MNSDLTGAIKKLPSLFGTKPIKQKVADKGSSALNDKDVKTLRKFLKTFKAIKKLDIVLPQNMAPAAISSYRRSAGTPTLDLAEQEWQALIACRIRFAIPVKEPMVLCSQIQRSGGTLISQLFDHHPQCHAHPHELKIGKPEKWNWPMLDIKASPNVWFDTLYETISQELYEKGYVKASKRAGTVPDVFPFIMPKSLQEALFHEVLDSETVTSTRTILDAYMTSYFNGWLDNHNLYTGPKRIVSAFVPRMNMQPENLDQFFSAYPDGKFLTIVREPKSWYVSARAHQPKNYENIETATSLWLASSSASQAIAEKYPDRTFVIRFETLVDDVDRVMRAIASFVQIDFDPILLAPTFNGRSIIAASSFQVTQRGVVKDPLNRHENVLSAAECEYIDRRTATVHRDLLTRAQEQLESFS